MALTQATGGEKPLAQTTGDWALFVLAVGGWAPLMWAGVMGGTVQHSASCVICRWQGQTAVDFSEARGRCGLPPLGACEWPHLQSQSPQGLAKKKKGHCNQAPHVVALMSLETHLPCSCHCQTLWVAPRCLITFLSQDPTTRSSW